MAAHIGVGGVILIAGMALMRRGGLAGISLIRVMHMGGMIRVFGVIRVGLDGRGAVPAVLRGRVRGRFLVSRMVHRVFFV